MYEIYSMLTINTAEQRHQRHCGVSLLQIVLVFLFLTLNNQMLVGLITGL